MFRLRSCLAVAVLIALTAPNAIADSSDSYWDDYSKKPQYWSVSLWTGPYAPKYFGAVLQDFNMQSHEMMAGVALDRKLARLWTDLYLSGEIHVSQTYLGHSDTTFAAMLGFEAENLFGYKRTSFSFYLGPSYGLNPGYYSIGYKHRVYPAWRKKFLNAVSFEFSSGLPFTDNWDWVIRHYHRSGMFGVYSDGDDDGLSFGLGLRYHF